MACEPARVVMLCWRGERDMRFCPICLMLAALFVTPSFITRAEETPEEEAAALRKKKQAADKKTFEKREERVKEVEALIKDLKAQREERSKPLTAEVTIDENKIEIKEARTMEEALGFTGDRRVRDAYEISPDDFEISVHERWSLNATDFKFERPQYITAEVMPGSHKTWFGFLVAITNSNIKPRRITPLFTAVTDRGTSSMATGGYIPERLLANSTFRPLSGGETAADKEYLSQGTTPLESVVDLLSSGKAEGEVKGSQTFEPGQTRHGAILWSDFDNNFSTLSIVVHGLSNAHKYEENLRRVLVLTFERQGDGINVARSELKYIGKKWEYLWMWDQEIVIPVPADPSKPQIKAEKLQTPSGGERYVFAFPFEIKNSTKVNQELSVRSVSFVCPVEVDVGGAKVLVNVRVNDDGALTIYKAQLLKGLGAESTHNRFQNKSLPEGSMTQIERNKVTIETGKSLSENWAVFDASDIDFGDAVAQVEDTLSRGFDKQQLSKQYWETLVKTVANGDPKLLEKNPGYLYNPRRSLNEEELKSVKEQIVKAFPDAVEKAKSKKTVTAIFDAVSGLNSGERRISRSYRKPGVADEYLKAIEDLEKESK